MRGLLFKDFRLIMGRRQAFLIYIVISCIMGVSMPDFLPAFLTLIAITLAASTIAYDEYDNGYSFLMTLPMSRAMFAVEKYLFGLICAMIGWGISLVIVMISNVLRALPILSAEALVAAAVVLPVMLVFLLIIFPLYLKFGSEKSRTVLLCLYGIAAFLIFCGKKLLSLIGISLEQSVSFVTSIPVPVVIVGLALLFCLAVILSVFFSIRVMEKKTF
ncbi:MAG: ABC-2 transporter permease [Acetatifactor sp.]